MDYRFAQSWGIFPFILFSVADPEWFIPDPACLLRVPGRDPGSDPDPAHIILAYLKIIIKNTLNTIKKKNLQLSAILCFLLQSYSTHSPEFTGRKL